MGPVLVVANERVLNVIEVYADLMSPPTLDPAPDEREASLPPLPPIAPKVFQGLVNREAFQASFVHWFDQRVFLPGAWISWFDRFVDGAPLLEHTVHQESILLVFLNMSILQDLIR